jgi:hypothetical protein
MAVMRQVSMEHNIPFVNFFKLMPYNGAWRWRCVCCPVGVPVPSLRGVTTVLPSR